MLGSFRHARPLETCSSDPVVRAKLSSPRSTASSHLKPHWTTLLLPTQRSSPLPSRSTGTRSATVQRTLAVEADSVADVMASIGPAQSRGWGRRRPGPAVSLVHRVSLRRTSPGALRALVAVAVCTGRLDQPEQLGLLRPVALCWAAQ